MSGKPKPILFDKPGSHVGALYRWKLIKPGSIIRKGDEILGCFGWVKLSKSYVGTEVPSSQCFGTIRRLVPAKVNGRNKPASSIERSRNYWRARALKAEKARDEAAGKLCAVSPQNYARPACFGTEEVPDGASPFPCKVCPFCEECLAVGEAKVKAKVEAVHPRKGEKFTPEKPGTFLKNSSGYWRKPGE
jgi:hypothetical protein